MSPDPARRGTQKENSLTEHAATAPRPPALLPPPQTPPSSTTLCFEHRSKLGAGPGTGAGAGMLCQRPWGGRPRAAARGAGAHLTIRSCDGAPCRPCRPSGRRSRGPSGTAEEKRQQDQNQPRNHLPRPRGLLGTIPSAATTPERDESGTHPPLMLLGTSRGSAGFTSKIWPDGCGQPQTPTAAQRAPSREYLKRFKSRETERLPTSAGAAGPPPS